jgi:threonylcarbamoyladenosine tRNA methylthiotransferase MtaB
VAAERQSPRDHDKVAALERLARIENVEWIGPDIDHGELAEAARECRARLLKFTREELDEGLRERRFIVKYQPKVERGSASQWQTREAEALVRSGCKEIVVAGVHVGLYGRGTDSSLSDVLARLVKIPAIRRIRMSSLHPNELTDELLAVWSSSPNVMPHLHLSLQSGSNSVLERMGRKYTSAEFLDAVERARRVLENPAITTDVIVGFPGETNEEFEQTFEFCKRIGFAGMHIFTFSPRPGTRAAEMPDPVPSAVAHERHQRLSALAQEMTAAFNRTFIGNTVNVLVERQDNHTSEGVTERYIPARFQCSKKLRGEVIPIRVLSASADGLNGEPV